MPTQVYVVMRHESAMKLDWDEDEGLPFYREVACAPSYHGLFFDPDQANRKRREVGVDAYVVSYAPRQCVTTLLYRTFP